MGAGAPFDMRCPAASILNMNYDNIILLLLLIILKYCNWYPWIEGVGAGGPWDALLAVY